jgi:hypothetical protein
MLSDKPKDVEAVLISKGKYSANNALSLGY